MHSKFALLQIFSRATGLSTFALEALYHYLWKNKMFGCSVPASDGGEVEILYPGIHNADAGPDFSAAVIRVGDMEWSGNIEIHVRASDWNKHGHNHDKAYDSVILHVVGVDDARVFRSDGSEILQTCVAPPEEFFNRYATLVEKMDLPACIPWVCDIPSLNKTDWISSLGFERLRDKARYLKSLLEISHGDWQQAIFILLARALGFGLNSIPFELLAKSLPLNFVMRHRDNPLQVEALVFGQAAMLNAKPPVDDPYFSSLCKEFDFLRKKYDLSPINESLWKYSRSRPHNFPHRRLAILASMLCNGMQLYTEMLEARGNYDTLMQALDVSASDYWLLHSRFGAPVSQVPLPGRLSRSSKDIILINVVAPFYLAYASSTGSTDFEDKAIALLENINSEKNSIVSFWTSKGFQIKSAFDSQAFIQLQKNYCNLSRCLDCRFGHWLLRSSMNN